MTTLTIVRHGETEWNATGRLMNQLDIPLSAKGFEQAARVGARLKGAGFAEVYCSDLSRAVETAMAVCPSPVQLSALRERHLGCFQGLTWDEIEQRFPAETVLHDTDPDYVVPGGESAREYRERTMTCLSRLVGSHPDASVLVVAHGGTLSTVLRHIMGLPPEGLLPAKLSNASVNVFEVDQEKWKLRVWGDVSHLA